MQKEDNNDCIRYLMKEMDPSEELLMERAMMEDDDLLIEVESLRQTMKRLDELPKKDPPKELCDSLVAKAAEHKREQASSFSLLSLTPVKYAAAASVIFVAAMGSFWLLQDSNSTASESVDQIQPSPASTAITNSSILSNSFRTSPVNVDNNDVEPWIDRDNIIRFQDRQNQANTDFDAIFRNSLNKLTPLDESSFSQSPNSRSLRMTGSSQ